MTTPPGPGRGVEDARETHSEQVDEVVEPADSDHLARDSALMASGSFVSRILGVVRASMIFTIFSNTTAGDTWQVANTLPNTVYLLLAGGVLNAILVPQITKAGRLGREGERYVDSLLTLAILAMGLLTAISLPLAPFLVRLFASSGSWDSAAFELSTKFAVLCLPAIFFYGLYTILGQVLNARGRFGAFMWAPVVCNIIWIVGLFAYYLRFPHLGKAVADWSPAMVTLLAGTMTLGVAAQALILVVPLWRDGFRFRPRFAFRGVGLRSAGRVALWTFAALGVAQLGLIVQSRVLTTVSLGDAGRLGYDNAFLLFMTPHGLITVSLVTALFTGMSHAAHHGQSALVARDVRRGMRLIALTMIPVSVASIALGTAATRILYPNLTVQATDSVGYILWAMALGLPGFGMYYLIQRAFYAYEDARTPFLLQVVNTLISVVVTLACQLAPSEYRAVGIGVGQALSNTVTAVIAIVLLRRHLGGLLLFDVIRTIVRVVVASLPAGLAAYGVLLIGQLLPEAHVPGLPTIHVGALVGVVVGGLVFLWLYAATARRMRLRELDDLLAPLVRRVRRFRPGSAGAV